MNSNDERTVFVNEAKHLFDEEVLARTGISSEYTITRIVVYNGESKTLVHSKGNLVLANLEEFICLQHNLELYLCQLPQIEIAKS